MTIPDAPPLTPAERIGAAFLTSAMDVYDARCAVDRLAAIPDAPAPLYAKALTAADRAHYNANAIAIMTANADAPQTPERADCAERWLRKCQAEKSLVQDLYRQAIAGAGAGA